MNCALKLLVVAALALALAPLSFANEWVPPDTIAAFKAPAFQSDRLATKDSLKYVSADNPTDVKKSGKRATNPVVQYTPMNDWVPLDMIGTWVIPFDP